MTLLSCCCRERTDSQTKKRRKEEEERRLELSGLSSSISSQLINARKVERNCLKLLLLGTGESGKSTILKQMKIIHINGYTDEEKLDFVSHVHRNIRDAMMSLLGGMRVLGVKFHNAENADLATTINERSLCDTDEHSQSFFDVITQLWKDEGIQWVFRKANAYQLLDSAKYFLDRVDVIRQDEYIPSDQDILRCRTMTDGINEVHFDVQANRKTVLHFRVFDVSGQRGARKKWIQLFDNVTAILFLVDCGSFDQVLREDRSQNRLIDSLEVFEQAWNNKYLQAVPMIVFLNKIDVLDDKIIHGERITRVCSFAANWIDNYEMQKYNILNLYSDDSKSQNDSHHCESVSAVSSSFTSTSCSESIQRPSNCTQHSSSKWQLESIDETSNALFNSPICDSTPKVRSNSPTKQQQSCVSKSPRQSSIRWRAMGLVRNVSQRSTSSIRRIRHSFRQASSVPVNPSPASCGQSSRLSCAITVARIIVDSPYSQFMPTAKDKLEFSAAIRFIERPVTDSDGNNRENIRELRNPHHETVRTACYIKHLFQEITKHSPVASTKYVRRRPCIFYYTCAVSTDCIRKVLDGCRQFLIEDHLERCGLI